jgi:glycosyltransferase involved in cell wall biosynthesis
MAIENKILLLLPLPPPYSGQEKMASIILNSRIVEEFDCIHIDSSNRQATNEDRGALKWVNLSRTIFISWQILVSCASHRPALLNLPLPCNQLGFFKYAAHLIASLPYRPKIISRLGASHFSRFYKEQNRILRHFIKWVLGFVDCIIVRGDLQKGQFSGIYSGRIESVYVPSTGIESVARKRTFQYSEKGEINVLFLAMVSQAKGAYDLLKAIPGLVAKDKRLRFHFVGDIVEIERNIVFLEKEVMDVWQFVQDNRIVPFVRFYGRIEGKEKDRLFEMADLFVFPSYAEGSPFAVVEAMEYGLPIVCTRVGNLVEIFEHEKNALFVNIGAPDQIGEAILKLIYDGNLRRALASNNLELLESVLSLEIYEDRMISLFKSVISGNHNEPQ